MWRESPSPPCVMFTVAYGLHQSFTPEPSTSTSPSSQLQFSEFGAPCSPQRAYNQYITLPTIMEDESTLQPADARWMEQFHKLQKQQVTALIQQNDNQKAQLEILAMQLEVEKQRRLTRHLAPDQVSAKQGADADISMQQLLSPHQDAALPIQNTESQDFEMSDFDPSVQQNFGPHYQSFGDETPQQNRNQQNYHQPQHQQENGGMALPRITDLDSPDNRLLMALGGYDLPPLSLPCPSIPCLPTPTGNRLLSNHEHSPEYLTPKYPPIIPNSVIRSTKRLANTTPSSSIIISPKKKRSRFLGPALPGYSSPAMLNNLDGSSYHDGQQNQALQSYATGVGKLAFSLTRKDLEECVMELALREEDISTAFHRNTTFDSESRQGFVRSSLLGKLSKSNRRIASPSKGIWPMTMGLSKGRGLGSFGKVPLEICKSLRALMSEPSLWGKVAIEPKTPTFSSSGFLRFLRSLPETSIRYFSFDTATCEPTLLNEIVDLILKKKHFGMVSLHLMGKKLSHAMVLNALKRLWSENLTTFSLTEVINSKLDSEVVNKVFLPLMPNLRKLRLEGGVWKVKELKVLSCIHGQLRNMDQNKLIGDNRLTHLSFVGKNTAICWDDLKNFGKWFPELEELFINCIYADEPSWVEKYTIGAVPPTEINEALAGVEYATKKYRTLTYEDVSWHAMPRLRYFGCDNVGDGTNKKHVKVFQDIHAAHIWSLIKGSNQTLERLEISRGEEHFKYERGTRTSSKVYAPLPQLIPIPLRGMLPVDFPKLTYLYLGHWNIPWRWFIGAVPTSSSFSSPAVSDASTEDVKESDAIADRERPNLRFNNVKTFILWKCSGLPTSVMDASDVVDKRWVTELKEVWGEGLEAFDDSIGPEKALKGNRGGGTW